MYRLINVLICYFLIATCVARAQGVGVNTDGSAPDASAILDVKSTDKGLLVPRVSLTNVTSASPVTAPATGLLVYNTNASVTGGSGTGFYYWDGTQWRRLDPSNSGDWRLTGNAGSSPSTHFLGTTDNVDLVFRTNNTERMRILNSGNVGIGTTSPSYRLEVLGGDGTHIGISGNLPAGDATQGLIGVTWRNATDNGRYSVFLADPDGGFGVTPRSWELWEYPSSAPNGCCRPRFRVMSSHGLNPPSEVVIDAQGRVGIATTSPTNMLHAVYQGTNNHATVMIDGPGNAQWGNVLMLRTTGVGNDGAAMVFRSKNTKNWIIGGETTAGTPGFQIREDGGDGQFGSGFGTPRVHVAPGGNVGIGTTNPVARLTVVGDGTGTAFIGGGFCGGNYTGISLNGQIGNCGVYNILSSPTDQNLYVNRPSGYNIQFRENNSTQMIINPGGFVGINETNPAWRLHINGWGGPSILAQQLGNHSYGIVLGLETFNNGSGTQDGPRLGFHKHGAKVWSIGIDPYGDNGFSIWEDGYSWGWGNNSKFRVVPGGGPTKVIISAGGSFWQDWPGGWGGGLASWDLCVASIRLSGLNYRSDERLKKNIVSLEDGALDVIDKLRPVSFYWKDSRLPYKKVYGFIAQEVQKILPEIIEVGIDPDKTLGMNYLDLIAFQTKAIQELHQKVLHLESQIHELNKIIQQFVRN